MKKIWVPLVFVLLLALLLAACAASDDSGEPASQPVEGAAPVEVDAPTETDEPAQAEPVELQPTLTPEIRDVPVFEGAEDYKSTGNGTYISYVVPDTTVEVVSKFYQEQLTAGGWEQKNKKDSGFGGSITILRSKPDKNISVTIDTNVVNNGVRVLITLIPK